MSWVWFNDTSPHARKSYRCLGCGEAILQGEKHLARRGIMDGKPTTDRWHPECEAHAFEFGEEIWESPPGSFTRHEVKARGEA